MRPSSPPATLLALSLAVSLSVLAGCGEDESSGKLGPVGDDADTSAPPEATSSASPDAETTPFDAQGHEAIRGDIEATTEEQKAVADAWMAYWTSRAKSYAEVRVDPDLGRYAAAGAVSDVVQYVAYLKGKKLRTVGDATYDVRDITVRGRSATLSSCVENKSVDRYADGSPGEQPVAFFTSEGSLVQNGGTWRVVEAPVENVDRCE